MLNSRLAKTLASILLPPVGLVLVWFRSGWRWPRKILVSLALTIWTFAALILFFGLRVEFNGGTTGAVFSFYKAEAHYEAIEKSRAAQQKDPVPAGPAFIADAPVAPGATKTEEPGAAGKTSEETLDKLPAVWTNYRGPNRDGIYAQTPTLDKWPDAGLKPVWSQPIGGGYASFVIAKGIAYTIDIGQPMGRRCIELGW